MSKKIPENPRITLDNYLLELVEDKDRKEASLYLNNTGWLIAELWSDILNNSKDIKQTRMEIGKSLGVHTKAIYGYKNNKKAISIDVLYHLLLLWKKYCKKTNSDVKKKWQQLYERDDWTLSTHSKHQKTRLPKYITPKMSYLIGWIVGDGHLKEAHNYLVKISEKSVDQLELVIKPLFKELFEINVPIFKRYMGGYAVQVGSKPVYRFIKNVLKIKVGKTPDIAWDLDEENKKHFLMGIFDAEGCVSPGYLNRRVTISQADPNFLREIMRLFRDVGIEFKNPVKHTTKLGTWYSIQVRKADELLKFCSEMNSYHVDKSKKLEMLVKEIHENRKH